jgi:predicted esterase
MAREEALRAGVGSGVPVVLAGASQGGRWAIQLSIDGRVPAAGLLVAVSGVPRPGQLEPHLPAAAGRGIRGWILTGELDDATPEAERLGRELAAAGLEVLVEPVEGLDHDYPEDFPARLGGGLAFVLDGGG